MKKSVLDFQKMKQEGEKVAWGLTPQGSGQIGGFKAQGRTAESAYELIQDARAVLKKINPLEIPAVTTRKQAVYHF